MSQHYPGLGHGSNNKETSVISIQNIYLLVFLKQFNLVLVYIFFSSFSAQYKQYNDF